MVLIGGVDLKLISAIIASLIAVFGAFFPYLRDIFRKKTKPHAYTWLIWVITQGTATTALWYGRGGWALLTMLIGTFFVFLIFLLSLKYGTRNITKGDTVVLMLALLAIVIWWQLNNPLLAVIMVSAIDVAGYLPSFRKVFHEPWSETMSSWAVFSLANIFNIFSLSAYNFLTLIYLVSITAANLILLVIGLVRRRKIIEPI